MATPPATQNQFIPCAPLNLPLVQIPELVSQNGKLRQTITLTDVTQRSNINPDPGNPNNCVAQYVRAFAGINPTAPAYSGAPPRSGYVPPSPPNQFYADPVPGPTLRARVGDLVQLTFMNLVDTSHYGDTIDAGDSVGACDESTSGSLNPQAQGYPAKAHEIYPNCFHGSSSANIHFHGTHVNPNSTGDNVFLNIAPFPRTGANRQPTVAPESVTDSFDRFFADCEANLKDQVLSEWPYLWTDLPLPYREQQEALLKAYDTNRPDAQKVWPIDEYQIATRQWPQYYIGAYPYCYRIPEYKAGAWPPPPAAPAPARVPGLPLQQPVLNLQMGQSPGTHWYHAHKHGSTTINVLNGMTGAFIIEGSYDDDLNRYYGTVGSPEVPWTRAQPVLVINELGVSPPLLGGGNPALSFSVNGRLQPVLTMRPGEVQLWRIVNTASRSFANIIGPPPGFAWRQIAQDGVQFSQWNYERNWSATSFLLTPGNRVDLLVKAPAIAPATPVPVMVQQTVTRVGMTPTSPSPVQLMSVQVTGTAPTNPNQTQFIPKAPIPPSFLADITDKEIKGTRNITFNSGPSLSSAQHTIDGKQYDGSTGEAVVLGRAEEWKVMNTTTGSPVGPGSIDHPFHIHVNPFQIVEVFDPNEPLTDANGRAILDPQTQKAYSKYVFEAPAKKHVAQCVVEARGNPASWKPCDNPWSGSSLIWWDTFPIPSGKIATDANGQVIKGADGQPIVIPGYFKMRSRFVDYPGLFVVHCHILAHEDRGMMTVVEVRPLYPPVQHH